jgi:hypothetical protein
MNLNENSILAKTTYNENLYDENLYDKNLYDENLYDEIIIGSGFSGLYWCYKNNSDNFLILEKSNRIGGRVHNIEWNKTQISLGGSIIKSSNNLTIKLVNELNLEIGESLSKYHLIDLENKIESINKPNEDNFYELNKLIIKYLKNKFEINKEQIKKNKLNWNEFLNLFMNLEISTYINSNLLYKIDSNSDIESVLEYEINELLRTENFKIFFIKQFGYTGLLNKLIDFINKKNIILNNQVNQIIKIDNIFKVITTENKIYKTKKIIFATESKTNIKFDLGKNNNHNLTNLYDMVSGSNYIKIYSFNKNGHGLEYSYRTSGMVGKVIYLNQNVLICCYTEENQAVQLNNLLNKNSKYDQIEIIYNLLKKCLIPIKTKPDDIIIKFWESGIHYNTVNYDKNKKTELLKQLKNSNIIVIGESVGNTHGWVNSAFESVDFINQL